MGIADGWQLDPHSAGSTMILNGPNGEQAVWGAVGQAVDPYHPQQKVAVQYGIYKGTGTILFPYQQDLVSAYPNLLQAWRRSANLPPVKLQVNSIEPDQQVDPKLGKCVVVKGYIDADGRGMRKLTDSLCITPLTQWGAYTIHRVYNIMTDAQFEREQSTVTAMMQTVKVNQQVMAEQTQRVLAQKQQSDRQWQEWGQQGADRIRTQSQAMQKSNAERQAGYDRQNADWNASQANTAAQHANWSASQTNNTVPYSNPGDGQDTRARNNQSFDNYILDQTVVQDNNMYNNGTIGHGTAWNSTADALVKADPNRFEIVDTPNYWRGVDY